MWFGVLIISLLALLALVQVTSIRQESQTYDEAVHLAAGYSYWKTGDYRMNPEHPPLGKLLSAVPLLFEPLEDVTKFREWNTPEGIGEFDFGARFLYHNREGADELLFRARLMTILLTMGLGMAVALWTRVHFGAPAAVLALALYCFDPNITAHGRYVTTDLIAALTIFLSCVTWSRYLESRRTVHLLIAGVTLGLALASKFSTVFLVPVLIVLWWMRGRKRAWALPVLFGVAIVVLAATYWTETGALLHGAKPKQKLIDVADKRTGIGQVLRWGAKHLHLPAHSYFVGLNAVSSHNVDGQESYLLGEFSQYGWWYYFPVVFAVKTPMAVWIAMLLCVILLWKIRWDQLAPEWLVIAVPPLAYFLLSMQSQLNLGMRHILPVYPFLYVALGVGLCALARKWFAILPGVVLLGFIEWAAVYPNYLPFFNWAAGGPGSGPKYVLDSNVDWGQDAKKLKAYMDARPGQKFCIEYFGSADLKYYGLPDPYVPKTPDKEGRANIDCLAAVSATLLYDLYIPKGSYEWLRERVPVDKIGYSIYVFDLRKQR